MRELIHRGIDSNPLLFYNTDTPGDRLCPQEIWTQAVFLTTVMPKKPTHPLRDPSWSYLAKSPEPCPTASPS